MDTTTIRLLTVAVRAGLSFTLDGDRVVVTGTPPSELLATLRAARPSIQQLLTGPCAACDAEPWIHEADTRIPWCRPDARRRGEQLLRAERPDLFERSAA